MNTDNTLKQPKVFYFSCITALCERFGYYAISFLLVLYLKSIFNFNDKNAFGLFAVFNALVFLTPAIGGYLADNYFGICRSMIIGLTLEGIGLLLLSIPCLQHFNYFSIALALIIIGVGLFKTGPTNLIARAYHENDPRVDSGFTLYYMIMNIGSFLAPIVTGYVQYYCGWHMAFLSGAIFLVLALLAYYFFRKRAHLHEVEAGNRRPSKKVILAGILGIFVTAAICIYLISHIGIADVFFMISSIILLLYFLFEIFRSEKPDRLKIIACLILILTGFIFFVLYFQFFTSITLYLKRCIDQHYLGLLIPVPVFLSLNGFWIIVLSPILAGLYSYLGKRGKDLAITTKFPLGVLITALCFFVLALSTKFPSGASHLINPLWFVIAILFLSLGELLISALGFAVITHIAPKRMYGVMMGSWFLVACALSSFFSGKVAGLASVPENMEGNFTVLLAIYGQTFNKIGIAGLIAAMVIFAIAPFVKKIANIK